MYYQMCGNFAVHSRTTVTFSAAGDTIYGGNVGVSPGTAITGKAAVTLQNAAISADSTDFAFDVVFAHSAAIAQRVDSKYIGMAADSAMNLAASKFLTLDGEGDPNSKFLFRAGTTLITGANTKVKPINGVKAENVLWDLGCWAGTPRLCPRPGCRYLPECGLCLPTVNEVPYRVD
jgi:hypothetical protein